MVQVNSKFIIPGKTLLLLDTILNLSFLILIYPPISYVAKCIMKHWGQSYITAYNLLSFLSYPQMLPILLAFILVWCFFTLFKILTVIFYCFSENMPTRPNIRYVLKMGGIKTGKQILSGNYSLCLYALLFSIFVKLPLLIALILNTDFPILEGNSDEVFLKVMILLATIFIASITFRGIFAIHFNFEMNHSFLQGVEQSKALLKGQNTKILRILIKYNLYISLGYYFIYYLALLLMTILIYCFFNKHLVISVFLCMYPKISLIATLIFSMVLFTANISFITKLYISLRKEQLNEVELPSTKDGYPHTTGRLPSICYGLLLLILGTVLIYFFNTVQEDSLNLQTVFSDIEISSHRGNSHVAPENTIPALQNAIIARSDYAEIDIQQTKDGVLVLQHDRTLQRTAGLNKSIKDLTYKNLRSLDVGSWFGGEFKETPIPTLEEALQFCKGRIKLNIEIKPDTDMEQITKRFVSLIKKYHLETQCLVSSHYYDTLVYVKKLHPKIKTGYIMSSISNYRLPKENVDFYCIRSHLITKQLVLDAHRNGKKVHAWTVNSVNEIERMSSTGVDCIVTDNPVLTKTVINHNKTCDTFMELLHRLLHSKPFRTLSSLHCKF